MTYDVSGRPADDTRGVAAGLALEGFQAQPDHLRPADAFIRAVADSIVSGQYEAYQALPPEAALGAHFHVSRTIVRESMKRLEEKGLVTIQQGRGTIVEPRGRWNVLDPLVLQVVIAHDEDNNTLGELTLVRGALEAVMAGQAASTGDDFSLIEEALERMAETADDYSAFREADADFHRAVMTVSGNFLAGNIANTLYSHARFFARFEGTPPPDAIEVTLAEHRAIFQALRDRDSSQAERAMSDHIEGAWRRRTSRHL